MPDGGEGPPDEYVRSYTFEAATPYAVTAADGSVALGYEDGPVELVGAERATVETGARDLAFGTRLYTLTDERIAAHSRGGTEVWSTEWPEAERVAATDRIVALVTADELVGLDGRTGTERFRVKRPFADIAGDPTVVGGADRFVVAAWSFLAVVTGEGDRAAEANVDGAIETAGLVGDTAVAALRDGSLVGIDVDSGTCEWQRESRVTWLPPSAESTLPAVTENHLLGVAPDGRVTQAAEVPPGEVYVAGSGDPACAIGDGTVACYRRAGQLSGSIDASLPAERLTRTADEFRVTIRNDGTAPATVPLSVSGTGIAFDPAGSSVEVSVGAGAERTVAFPVSRFGEREQAEITVTAADETLIDATLSVADPEPTDRAIEAEATVERIEGGCATVALAVDNRGGSRIDDLHVGPVDETLPAVDPGETVECTVDVPVPIEGDLAVTWDGGDAAVALDVPPPADAVSLAAAPTDDFVDVRVGNEGPVPFRDDLRVDGSAIDPLERSIDVPPDGGFTLALRPRRPGTVAARLDGLGVSASAEVERAPGRSGREGDDAAGGPDRPRDGRRDAGGTDATTDSPERPADRVGSPRAPGAGSGWSSERGATRGEDGRGGATDPDDPADAPRRRDRSSTPSREMSVDRELGGAGGEVRPWEAIRERVTVENRADAPLDRVAIEATDGEGASLDGPLSPGETATFTRYHALPPGGALLPDVEVTAVPAETTAEPTRVAAPDVDAPAVARRGFVARLHGERGPDSRLTLRASNADDTPHRITGVRVAGHEVPDPDDWTVPPGETDRRSVAVEGDFGSSPLRAILLHAVPGGDVRRFKTLVPVTDPEGTEKEAEKKADEGDGGVDASGAADPTNGGLAGIGIDIADVSSTSDGDSAIVDLAVRNDADGRRRVRVTPEGEALVDVLATAMTETIEPGEVEPFGIHVVSPSDGRDPIEAEAVVALPDAGESRRVRIVGPTPAAGAGEVDLADDWTVEGASSDHADAAPVTDDRSDDAGSEPATDDGDDDSPVGGRISTAWRS